MSGRNPAAVATGHPDAVVADLQRRGMEADGGGSTSVVGIGRGTRGAAGICGGDRRRSGRFPVAAAVKG
jgi:hypothetical protein